VRSVNLPVDVTGIEKQHRVNMGLLRLALVEKPERHWQGDCVKHVWADSDHHVHSTGFNDLLTEFQFGTAGVGRGVCHDESGAALVTERGIEKLNPEVIPVIGARQTKRKAAARADGIFQPLLVHSIDVERRIGENKIKFAGGLVRIVVIAVNLPAVADVAFQSVHRKIHAAEASGVIGLLNAVDGKFGRWIFLMFGYEAGGSNEHIRDCASIHTYGTYQKLFA
jgi:hypothetical protein